MFENSDIKRFEIDGPVLITAKSYSDERGRFAETWRADKFAEIIGHQVEFVQDNLASSKSKGTIRGLHAQKPPFAVGKLVACLHGSIRDVAVDIRKNSPSFGKYISVILDSSKPSQFWVPEGFAHGYETLSDNVLVGYKQTGYYAPKAEISLLWNDSDININWSVSEDKAIVSQKDRAAPKFANFTSPF